MRRHIHLSGNGIHKKLMTNYLYNSGRGLCMPALTKEFSKVSVSGKGLKPLRFKL